MASSSSPKRKHSIRHSSSSHKVFQLSKSAGGISQHQQQPIEINNHPVNFLRNIPKSFSTADIGNDRNRDEKRAGEIRELLRTHCQPKAESPVTTPREQRRKQVDAIYSCLHSHGMATVPEEYQQKLEEYVFENKRYFAWVPTEPKYLVICEPTPEVQPTDDQACNISQWSTLVLETADDKPDVPGAQTGKPQGFLAAIGGEFYEYDTPEDPSVAVLWGSAKQPIYA